MSTKNKNQAESYNSDESFECYTPEELKQIDEYHQLTSNTLDVTITLN